MKVVMDSLKENIGLTEPRIKKKSSKGKEEQGILQTFRNKSKEESIRLEKLLQLK